MRQAAMKELARRELARRQQAQTNSTPNVIEEMHDDVTWKDRAIVKNFSQSPEKSAQYIQGQHPNLDTRVQDGRVLVKGKSEKDWRVIDPDTGFFSSDFLYDVGDVAYDVGSGVAEGAALAGGTIAASPVGGVAASAATGAASEGIRQAIGRGLGIDNELEQGAVDSAVVGAISGAIPLAGKALKPVTAPAIKAMGKGARKTVEKLTQATDFDIDNFVNRGKDLDNILDSDTGFTDLYEGIAQEANKKYDVLKRSLQDRFAELRKQGVDVDMSSTKEVYDDMLGQLEKKIASGTANKSDEMVLNAVRKERDELFQRAGASNIKQTTGNQLTGQRVNTDIDDFQDIGNAMDMRQNLAARANFSNKSQMEKSLQNSSVTESLARKGYGRLGEAIDNVVDGVDNKELRKEFKATIDFATNLSKKFKDAASVERLLKNADRGSSRVLEESLGITDKKLGMDLISESKLASTAQALKKNESGTAIADLVRPKSALELFGMATGAKIGWATGQPYLIPATLAAGAAVGRKLGSVKAARRYVDFILDVEGKAIGLDNAAKEVLRKELMGKITGADALREAVKSGAKASRER